jgi:hypothetical protein
MHRIILIALLMMSWGCKNDINPSDLKLLNGYWKIEFITHKNETFHPKGLTQLLDFYEVDTKGGVRKKVQPKWDNTFSVTDDQNQFKLLIEEKAYYLQFKTLWDQWRERIIVIDEKKLILEHQEKRYHYSRYQNKN